MYLEQQRKLATHVRAFLREKYNLDLPNIVIEQPPNVAMGEFALPFSFELAKRLRKPPRKIAEEIAAGMPLPEGFEKLEVAGRGLHQRPAEARRCSACAGKRHSGRRARVTRARAPPTSAARFWWSTPRSIPTRPRTSGICATRFWAIRFVRLLRAAGHVVDIQNYIDNTGVQVADVVVGFIELEKKSKAEIAELIATDPRFDYYCWDLYARVSQWYEAGQGAPEGAIATRCTPSSRAATTLAEIAEMISMAVLRRHLETMDRLDIEYDFLPRESEILHLHFWEAAFELLKAEGRSVLRDRGKEQGMLGDDATRNSPKQRRSDGAPGEKSPDEILEDIGAPYRQPEGPDEDAKVIVRSNGTVGYVGKDIAYHLWKFGLLGRDFGYRRFYQYPNQHEVWISAEHGEPDHPHFGGVGAIYNVIDSRQSRSAEHGDGGASAAGLYRAGGALHALLLRDGGADAALRDGAGLQGQARKISAKSYIEVSGRKGFGVKADDLLDELIAAAKKEVDCAACRTDEAERTRSPRRLPSARCATSC